VESVIRPNVRSAGLRISLAQLGGGREMLNQTNRITYWKLFNGAPGPRTTVEMIDKLMDAARAEGKLDATYAKAKVIYDAVNPFVGANDHGRLHDAITRITRQVGLAGDDPAPPALSRGDMASICLDLDKQIVDLTQELAWTKARLTNVVRVLRDVLDMLIGMSHPPVSSQADQRKWSPVMETIAHETDWPSLLAIVHWAWRETRPDAPEIVLAIGPSLESVEKLESEVRAVLFSWEPLTTVAEDKPPPISDPVRVALIAEARELAAHVGPEGGQGTAQMIRKLANALEDAQPLTEVPRDREMARRLVDAVWGYLEGDESVPSTRVADKIIDQAAAPASDDWLVQRVELSDGAVYLTKGQIDLMRLIWEGGIVALDDPRMATLRSNGMLEGAGALTTLTKRGREVVERLVTARTVTSGKVVVTGTMPRVDC
jgi:hypothetical protein